MENIFEELAEYSPFTKSYIEITAVTYFGYTLCDSC